MPPASSIKLRHENGGALLEQPPPGIGGISSHAGSA